MWWKGGVDGGAMGDYDEDTIGYRSETTNMEYILVVILLKISLKYAWNKK